MTRLVYYILDADRNPVPVADMLAWAAWFESVDGRRVALTEIAGCAVSTVFVGLDRSFGRSGRPILFETMVCGSDWLSDLTERCATWAEAEVMHRRVCERVEVMANEAKTEIAKVLR